MNIAFDATALLGGLSKNRGIGNYAADQFRTMICDNPKDNFFMLNFMEKLDCEKYFKFGHKDNFKECFFDCGREKILLTDPLYKELIGSIIKKFIYENDIDVFYITSPFENVNVEYEKDWFRDTKVVITVYDIIPYIFKEHYLSDKNGYRNYIRVIERMRWADEILVISQSVKDDLISYLKFDPEKIHVIYGASSAYFQEIEISPERKARLYKKYGIENQFLMCTGGDDLRKNIGGLIKAYSNISDELRKKYQLVVACRLSAQSERNYRDLIRKLNLKDRVILTNFVSTEELRELYNLAELMVFPSKYEGFGLPIVEAWACGTPVLTSNNSSLGEIAQGAGVLVDPNDENDVTRGLEYALTEADLGDFLKKGKVQLRKFQWTQVAERSMEVIRCLKKNEKNMKSMKKIAFFTPLPPLESGISDYSVDILSKLGECYDIDVYIDKGYAADLLENSRINILEFTAFDEKASEYDEIVYQMGNSEFHEYMIPYIRKYPGVLVLHDYNLHSLVYFLTMGKYGRKQREYHKILEEDFEADVVNHYLDDLKFGKTGPQIHNMEVNSFVTNYAKKIIVHSRESKEKLLRKNISRIVRVVPSYAKIEPLVDVEKSKREMGYDVNTKIFASFGHVHETKRVIPILKAFSRLSGEYANVKYIFVGKLSESIEKEFEKIVKENHLEEYVQITGYTSLNDFVKYINLADMCFNLRYPYNGETSGSLMRILAKGKLVVVNNIGSFSEIPDTCCVKLPAVSSMSEDEEIEKIYKTMEGLMKGEINQKEIEANARMFAEENLALDIVGKQYESVINEKVEHCLTEEKIEEIADNISRQFYTTEEMLGVSATLGYLL